MTKKIILLGLSIILLIGVSGCMEKHKPEVDVKAEVEKYLKDKYNENFTVTGGGTESWDSPDTEIYAKPEKFPEERVMVRRGKKTGGMIDNYTGILMKSKIDEIMTDIVSQVYPKCKVWFEISKSPEASAGPEMSVEDYLEYESKHTKISLTICASDPEYTNNKDEKAEELRKKFEAKQYVGDFAIFYMLEGKLEAIDEANKNEVYHLYSRSKWCSMVGFLSMDESYKYDSVSSWEEIK